MQHTNNYTKVSNLQDGINLLTGLGYTENPKTELQQLGYTDGTLNFTNGNLFASVGPCLHGGFNVLY